MKKGMLIAIVMSLSAVIYAQADHGHKRDGDKNYYNQEYSSAELDYRKALEAKQGDARTQYNLGNSIYKQERYDEALEKYAQAVDNFSEPNERASALYNLGLAQLQNQKFQESANSFIESLQLNPNDPEAKKNLLEALKMAKIQQQQQQQNQEQNQDQQEQQEGDQEQQEQQQQSSSGENQEQQERQQQGENQSEPSEEEKQEQQQKSEEEQEGQEQEQEPQESEGNGESGESDQLKEGSELSDDEKQRMDEMMRVLEMVEEREKEVHKQLSKSKNKKQVLKDW